MRHVSRSVWIALWVLFLISCSTAPKKQPPQKLPPSAVSEFNRIKADIPKVKSEMSIARLNKFVASYPGSDLTDDALITLGNLYFQRQDYKNAHQNYFRVVSSDVASPRENEAVTLSAKSLFHMGRYDEALELVARGLKSKELTPQNEIDMREMRFVIQNHLGNRVEALREVAFLANRYPDTDKKERYRLKGIELVETKLNEAELQKVSRDSDFGYLQAYAYYRLGTMALDKQDTSTARDAMYSAQSRGRGTEVAERAAQVLEQLEARRRVNSNTVGVVLPLTGKYQAMGYRTLHGIQLALGIFGERPSSYRLAIVDSEGNPDLARRAVEKLVTEDSVIAIIGGLLSKTATAEASKAQELGVPLIALSQSAGVTEIGPGIFRNALTSQMQVRKLVAQAMDKLGYRKFALMFPTDPYGQEFSNLFWDEVSARGGQVVGAQSYDPKETDFRVPVQKLVGTYYPEDRADEYKLRLKEWQDKQTRKTNQKPPENLLPPIVDFDAIFIPDSARAVGQIAPMLAYNDVDKVTLIGTNLWNTPDLIKRGQKFVEKAVFVDSLMENDPTLKTSRFYADFKQSFQEEPGLFEVQAYDSALILRQLLSEGASSRASMIERLSRLRNFAGSIGTLSMNENREILRPMINLTVEKGEIIKAE